MNKTIYVRNQEVWEQAEDYANRSDISMSNLIELALSEYVSPKSFNNTPCKKCERIREILNDLNWIARDSRANTE